MQRCTKPAAMLLIWKPSLPRSSWSSLPHSPVFCEYA